MAIMGKIAQVLTELDFDRHMCNWGNKLEMLFGSRRAFRLFFCRLALQQCHQAVKVEYFDVQLLCFAEL